MVVDTQGHILTNNHVVEGANRITVSLGDGRSFDAQLIGRDPITDLAVIRIAADRLTPAKLGDTSKLEVGEDVVAIGHALDLPGGPTVSKGVVSALNRSIQVDEQTVIDGLVQIDAPINPGNSGGPLVNNRGEVVGVNTAIIPGSQGIGFAININDARMVMGQLLAKGSVERAFLGIVHVNITSALARTSRLPVDQGVGVVSISRGSPAERAGLKEGDILVQIGDQPLKNTADLIRFLTIHKSGESVDIVFFRDNTKRTLRATLGSRSQ
jgi:serine protease Do